MTAEPQVVTPVQGIRKYNESMSTQNNSEKKSARLEEEVKQIKGNFRPEGN